jgi:hypothetical protein
MLKKARDKNMESRVRASLQRPTTPPPTTPAPRRQCDMHIVLVKLDNRAGIEVKIRVRPYLISPR